MKKNPTIEETWDNSIGQIVPNDEYVSNDDIPEQETCGGGPKIKSARLTGHETSPTGPYGNFGQPQKYDEKETKL